MFCQECGTQFDGKFCPNCGTPAGSTKITPSGEPVNIYQDYSAPAPEKKFKKKKKKKGGKPIIPIIVGIIIVFALLSTIGSGSGSGNSNPDSQASGTEKQQVSNAEEQQEEVPAAEQEKVQEKEPVQQKSVDYAVRQEYFQDYVDSIGTHKAGAFVEIENTGNTPLYLHDGQFDIEDNDGHLLTTENMISTCPDAIFPGEIGYFYDDYIDLSDVDSSNGLKFVPHYKVEEARHEIIDYEVSDIGIREDNMFKCKVSGRLTNTSEEEINLLYINVIYYDGNGNVIGISGTNVMDIQPGDTTSFEITGSFFSDNVGYADIAEYRVIPRAWYMQF